MQTIMITLLGIWTLISVIWALSIIGDKDRDYRWWEILLFLPSFIIAAFIGLGPFLFERLPEYFSDKFNRIRKRLGNLLFRRTKESYTRSCRNVGELRKFLEGIDDEVALEDIWGIEGFYCKISSFEKDQKQIVVLHQSSP